MSQTYAIAYYTSETDRDPKPIDATWDEIIELLSPHVERETKSGPAWSPVVIEGPRAARNVRFVTCAVFDLDTFDREPIAGVTSRYRCVLHTTHSHTQEKPKLRLVMPLARPVPGHAWPATHRALVEYLGIPADPTCKDASRLYYLPSHPAGAEFGVKVFEGELLDGEVIEVPEPKPFEASQEFLAPAGLADARAKLANYCRRANVKAESKEIVRLALAGESLGGPGERDMAVNRLASVVAFAVALPTDVAVEVVRPALSATPSDSGHDWVAEFRDGHDRALERKAEADEQKRATEEAIRQGLRASLPAGGTPEPAPEPGAPKPAWFGKLSMDGKTQRPEPTYSNVAIILSNAAGDIRWDVVKRRLAILSGPFIGVNLQALGVAVAGWLEIFGVRVSSQRAVEQLYAVAMAKPYDPIAEYLAGVTWDGVARLDNWLETYAGASGEFARLVGRKWMISAVARGLRPGCQVDCSLVLEGAQGTMKTSIARVLSGPWFDSLGCALGDKESRSHVTSSWIVELAELSAVKRSDQETLKGFLIDTVDRYRPPYGRVVEEFPRRCVFIGTTNESVYLRDSTGNRRYWPVAVGKVDLEALKRDRDQLFAEAVVAFKAGERWWLDEKEYALAEVETSEREEENEHAPMAEAIVEWFTKPKAINRPKSVTTREVGVGALKLEDSRIDRGMQMRIGRALALAGFSKKNAWRKGNIYFPPAELRDAPSSNGRKLHAVD